MLWAWPGLEEEAVIGFQPDEKRLIYYTAWYVVFYLMIPPCRASALLPLWNWHMELPETQIA
jgi:hypothetical protein